MGNTAKTSFSSTTNSFKTSYCFSFYVMSLKFWISCPKFNAWSTILIKVRAAQKDRKSVNRGLKIGAGQRSRSMALAKWIAASGDENVENWENDGLRNQEKTYAPAQSKVSLAPPNAPPNTPPNAFASRALISWNLNTCQTEISWKYLGKRETYCLIAWNLYHELTVKRIWFQHNSNQARNTVLQAFLSQSKPLQELGYKMAIPH